MIMDDITNTNNNHPSDDVVFNSLDIIDELSYVTIDSNDMMLGLCPQPNTEIMDTVNETNSSTSTNPTQQNNTFLLNYSGGTNTSNKLESIINETICSANESGTILNYEELLSSDVACAPSSGISTFCNSQPTAASTNVVTYHMLNPVEQNQVLQEPLQGVSSEFINNGSINNGNTIIGHDSGLNNLGESNYAITPCEGSTSFKTTRDNITQHRRTFNTQQQGNLGNKVLNNAAYGINDEVQDKSQSSNTYDINEDPLVLVPLSILRPFLKTNNCYALSHGNSTMSILQDNSSTHPRMQNNISNIVNKEPGEDQGNLHEKLPIEGSTTASQKNLIQTTQKNKPNGMKNTQRNLKISKVVKRDKIGRKRPKHNQSRKLTSGKDIRSLADVASPLPKVHNGKVKSSENSQKPDRYCKVCGDEASVHVHYGGRSCKSCRAFFRRTIEKSTRQSCFGYPCKCVEGCIHKGKTICSVSKLTRNQCKYCRFIRCQELAGMSKQCVISAHIPKVQRRPRMNTKEATKGLTKEKNDNLKKFKSFIDTNTISQVDHDDAVDNNLPFSVDIQWINELKGVIDTEGTEISTKTQVDLLLHLNQQISSSAMNIPEFSGLKSKIGVSLMQKNSSSLLRFGLVRFIYDHIFLSGSNCSRTLALNKVLSTAYCKENSFSTLGDAQFKRCIRKIVELINGDRKMFAYLFPILLFNSAGEYNEGITQAHQLYYMGMLEEYLVTQLKNNRKLISERLGVTIEIIDYLQ